MVGPILGVLGLLWVAAATLTGPVGWGTSTPAPRHSTLHSIPIKWPVQGQAAIRVAGRGQRLEPWRQPVPIASVAKVMTAYVVPARAIQCRRQATASR